MNIYSLGIQDVIHMSHIFFCGLSTSVIFFFTISHKRYCFRKKLMNIKCVCLIFCTSLSQTFIILRRTERVMIKNVYRSSWNVPVILVRVEFSRQIKKKKKCSNVKFHKNRSSERRNVPCGRRDGQLQTDRQTDMTKLTVAFRNFSHAPKKSETVR